MLIAHPEMNLEEHLAVVGSRIIEVLQKNGDMVFDSLVRVFLRSNELYSPDQFLDAIVFLYSIGGLKFENDKVGVCHV